MKTTTKAALVALAGTVVAFALGPGTPMGRELWPAAPLSTEPTPAQEIGFASFGLIEAIAFGLGVAFLAFAYGPIRRRTSSRGPALAIYLASAWLLVSWFPHDNLHMVVGEDPAGLLGLLWVFHGTLIASGAVLAYVLLKGTTPEARATPAAGVSKATATGSS